MLQKVGCPVRASPVRMVPPVWTWVWTRLSVCVSVASLDSPALRVKTISNVFPHSSKFGCRLFWNWCFPLGSLHKVCFLYLFALFKQGIIFCCENIICLHRLLRCHFSCIIGHLNNWQCISIGVWQSSYQPWRPLQHIHWPLHCTLCWGLSVLCSFPKCCQWGWCCLEYVYRWRHPTNACWLPSSKWPQVHHSSVWTDLRSECLGWCIPSCGWLSIVSGNLLQWVSGAGKLNPLQKNGSTWLGKSWLNFNAFQSGLIFNQIGDKTQKNCLLRIIVTVKKEHWATEFRARPPNTKGKKSAQEALKSQNHNIEHVLPDSASTNESQALFRWFEELGPICELLKKASEIGEAKSKHL